MSYNLISSFDPGIFKMGAYFGLGVLLKPITTYIHEKGHVITIKALYENSHPKTQITKWGFESSTEWGIEEPRTLSRLGKIFGKNIADVIISSAGPLTEMVSAIGLAILSGEPKTYLVIIPSVISIAESALKSVIRKADSPKETDFSHIKRITPVYHKFITTGVVGIAGLIIAKAVSVGRAIA